VLIGCNPTIRRLEIVRIGNIRLDSITPDLITLRAELTLKNPYSSSARIKSISFDLALDNGFFAYGKRTELTELKPGSVIVIDVPLAVHTAKVSQKDLDSLMRSQIPYRIQGSAILEKPFGPRTIPIEIRSHIKAPPELRIFLQERTARSMISLQRFETRLFLSLIRQGKLPVRFHNPFRFPITIRSFAYHLEWGKHVIADGLSRGEFQLSPGENRMEIQIQPKPLGAIEGLFQGILDQQIPDLSFSSDFKIAGKERDLAVQFSVKEPAR
jgi:LEA14-like dessication related protein